MNFRLVIISTNIHSHAWDEVVETTLHGLRALGHDVALGGVPSADRTSIIFGANVIAQGGWEKPPAGSVIYNLEQLVPGSPWITPAYVDLCRAYTLWDFDAENVRQWARIGVQARHVPIGYVPELSRILPRDPKDEDVDVLFYGSVNARRRAVLDAIAAQGLRVEALFGVYGEERDAWIARSKVVLNMHFYEGGTFEAPRVCYLLANRRFVVSEGPAPFEVVTEPIEQLARVCAQWARESHETRQTMADVNFDEFAERMAGDILRPAVEALPKPATMGRAPTLEDAFRFAASNRSDINEHVERLRGLAAECQHVTEFGVRGGVSTVALLAGQPPTLVSYDINDCSVVQHLRPLHGATDWRFIVGDTREIEIEPTDMLFIDTLHTCEQLRAELTRHAGRVRRFIVLHDTETFGTVGEDGLSPGLNGAVEAFLASSGEWKTAERRTNNNGLTVLRRTAGAGG